MADNIDIEIKCPACGKEMKKIFLPEQGINLDVCLDGCGGIYFDNREFLKVDEPHEDITPLIEVFEGRTFNSTDESQIRVCPICDKNMVKNFASAKHEVEVDECYYCGGKFLDYGELDKIRGQYTTEKERAADVIKELYLAVGEELKNFEQKYEAVEKYPKNNLYREIKIKTNKEEYIKKYKNYHIRKCSLLGAVIGIILGSVLIFAKSEITRKILSYCSVIFGVNNIGAIIITIELFFVIGFIIGMIYAFLTVKKVTSPKPLK